MPRAHDTLRIASWNTACGSIASSYNPPRVLIPTIKTLAEEHDVVALQEVHWSAAEHGPRFATPEKKKDEPGPFHVRLGNEIYSALRRTHHVYFAPNFTVDAYHDREARQGVQWGNMLIVRRNGKRQGPRVTSEIAYGTGGLSTEVGNAIGGQPASRSLQVITLMLGQNPVTIAAGHGIWSKHGKVDCPPRIAQNTRWAQIINKHQPGHGVQHPVCLIGDLNLTSQLDCFEQLLRNQTIFGLHPGVNLNARYGITDTRTKHYPKPGREADFALASHWLAQRATSFQATHDVDSDHAILSLTFTA